MHLKFSSLTTGVLLAVSSLSFAGSMGGIIVEESPGKVSVPCHRSSWQLGVYGMYLQPSYSGQLPYLGSDSTTSSGGTTANTQNVLVKERWHWAWMIEGGYHFNCGSDITLSWLNHSNTINQSYFTSNLTVNQATSLYTNIPYSNTASTKLTFDRFDIEMGQHVDYGENKVIRFHGGIEFAKFDFTSTASGVRVSNSNYTNAQQKTAKFHGFGPRVGMDLSYYMIDGLAIYSKGAIAALVGKAKSQNIQGFVDPTVPSLTITYEDNQSKQIVPVIALNLGLKYTYSVYQNVYSLDLGYMWSDYIAIARNLNATTGRPTDSNFYLQGPYLGVRWLGQA